MTPFSGGLQNHIKDGLTRDELLSDKGPRYKLYHRDLVHVELRRLEVGLNSAGEKELLGVFWKEASDENESAESPALNAPSPSAESHPDPT